jgi:hypothetical protein
VSDATITHEEAAQVFRAGLAAHARAIACVAVAGERQMLLSKGTAVLAKRGERHHIVTASHVVREPRDGEVKLLLVPLAASLGVAVPPDEFAFSLTAPLVDHTELDVAVLDAPRALVESPGVVWLDIEAHARSTAWLRAHWKNYDIDDATLPLFVLGFPNFGHLIDAERCEESVSAIPFPAWLSHIDLEAWDGNNPPSSYPQVNLSFPTRQRHDIALSARETLLQEKLFDGQNARGSAFGGYSGGPIFLGGRNGLFWVASVKEGGPMFGDVATFATATDDILTLMQLNGR